MHKLFWNLLKMRIFVQQSTTAVKKLERRSGIQKLAKVPYMLVVGEKEMNENKVSVRRQGKGDLGAQDVEEFIK